MDNITLAKELVSNIPTHIMPTNTKSGEGSHTKYLDKEYITRAREAEVKQHLHSIGNLQKKMEKLAGELAWELEQHHSKIHELYQLEAPFRKNQESTPAKARASKKTQGRSKNKQAFAMPLIGEPLCESFV